MPRNKDQHFLSRAYLRNFSYRNDYIRQYIISIDKFKERSSISGQCQRPYFFSKADEYEVWFNKLEGFIGGIEEKLNMFTVTIDMISSIKEYILLEFIRNAKLIDCMFDTLDSFQEPIFRDDTKIERSAESTRNIIRRIFRCRANLGIDLYDLHVMFGYSAGREIFTSDHPVMSGNEFIRTAFPDKINTHRAAGFYAILPLSSKWITIVYDARAYAIEMSKVCRDIFIMADTDVYAVNEMTFLNSNKCLYFANMDSASEIKEHVRVNSVKANYGYQGLIGIRTSESFFDLIKTKRQWSLPDILEFVTFGEVLPYQCRFRTVPGFLRLREHVPYNLNPGPRGPTRTTILPVRAGS